MPDAFDAYARLDARLRRVESFINEVQSLLWALVIGGGVIAGASLISQSRPESGMLIVGGMIGVIVWSTRRAFGRRQLQDAWGEPPTYGRFEL